MIIGQIDFFPTRTAETIEIVESIKESTAPEKIIETVVYSNEFESITEQFTTQTDLEDYTTEDEMLGALESSKSDTIEYIDSKQVFTDEKINELSSKLSKTESDITAAFKLAGGINLIKNSTGYFGLDNWIVTGELESVTNVELEKLYIGYGFRSRANMYTLTKQSIYIKSDMEHTISFFMQKRTKGKAYVLLYNDEGAITHLLSPFDEMDYSNEFRAFSYTFKTDVGVDRISIGFECDKEVEIIITALMLNESENTFAWTMHKSEIASTNVQMNMNGIKVINQSGGYTVMSPNEFSGYSYVTDIKTNETSLQRIFTLNGATTEVQKLKVEKSIELGSIVAVDLNESNVQGLSFFKNKQSEGV